MAQNNVTKLVETTLNSRDRKWNADSLVKVKAAWNNIDHGSREFETLAQLLDMETLERAGIDTTSLPRPRPGAGELYDPVTGCSRQGQATGLLQCLSIRGFQYYGCLVQCGEKRIKCVARRTHLWHRQYGIMWNRHWYDATRETVDISGACFVQNPVGKLTRFFHHGKIKQEDLITPKKVKWRSWSVPRTKKWGPDGFEAWGEGFYNPGVTPNFYFPNTLEYQIPKYKCSPGFALSSPYLKVAVIGTSVLICMAAVSLHKYQELFKRKHWQPFYTLQTIRNRNDYGGWSCRLFDTKELPSFPVLGPGSGPKMFTRRRKGDKQDFL